MGRFSICIVMVLPALVLAAEDSPWRPTERIQPSIRIEAKKIGDDGAGEFRLQDAVDLLATATGNSVRIAPTADGSAPPPRPLDIAEKAFWDAIPEIEKAWGLVLGFDSRRTALLSSAGADDAAPKLGPITTDGPFRLRGRATGDAIDIELTPEPRLRFFALAGARLTGITKQGRKRPFRFYESTNRKHDALLSFRIARQQPVVETFTSAKLDATLEYFHDWRWIDVGTLADAAQRKKLVKVGRLKLTFADTRFEIGRDGARSFSLRASDNEKLLIPGDLELIDARGKRHPRTKTETADADFGVTFEGVSDPKDVRIWVRAPHKVKVTRLKVEVGL